MRKKIIDLKHRGVKINKISEITNVPVPSVKNVLYRRKNQSMHLKCYFKRSGGQRKIFPAHEKKIMQAVKEIQNLGQLVTARKVIKRTKLDISRPTMSLYLKKNGCTYDNIERRIYLKEEHLQKRRNFALDFIDNRLDESKIIFTDEKKFRLDAPDNRKTWTTNTTKTTQRRRQNGGGGLMFHATMCSDGWMHFTEVSHKMNAKSYQEFLEKELFPIVIDRFGPDFIFQQDNAPCHSARLIKQYLEEQQVEVLNWPPLSPDLNIVEDIWAYLVSKIYDGPVVLTVKDLREKVLEHANQIPKSLIDKLYASFPDRLRSCLKNGGDLVK